MTVLALPHPQRVRLDDTINALEHLVRTEGEPSQGGEQIYNRIHLHDLGHYHIPKIIEAQPGEATAQVNLDLLNAVSIFMRLWHYTEVSLDEIKRTYAALLPYRTPPAVRVVERPPVMKVARPDDTIRANAAAILSQDLSRPMKDVEQALADLAEAGYIIVRKN